MAAVQQSLSEYVYSLLEDGHGKEEIEKLLLEKGNDPKFVKELISEVAKLRQSKRMSQGLGLILLGAVICLTSCVITLTQSLSHDTFMWVLYGLTSVGILVVFAGFMRVF